MLCLNRAVKPGYSTNVSRYIFHIKFNLNSQSCTRPKKKKKQLENKMYNRIKIYILYEVTCYIWLFLPINLVR